MWNLIISLIMAIISFVTTKKGKAKNEGKAAAAAVAAGLGTSYLLSNTEWGQDSIDWLNNNVANLDGTAPTSDATKTSGNTLDPSGSVRTPTGTKPTGTSNTGTGFWDVLKSWGPTGTAAVVGTTGVVTGTLTGSNKWLWIGGGILAFVLLMK